MSCTLIGGFSATKPQISHMYLDDTVCQCQNTSLTEPVDDQPNYCYWKHLFIQDLTQPVTQTCILCHLLHLTRGN